MVLIAFANEQMTSLIIEKNISSADSSVNDLKDAVNDVYFQGKGAKRLVFITIPEGTDTTGIALEGKLIIISVNGNDRFAEADVNIVGNLPSQPGGYWLLVEANEGYVSVGETGFSLNKSSIYATMLQEGSANDSIRITNNSGETLNVNIVVNWSHSDVGFVISDDNFSIGPADYADIDLSFSANASATGNYTGSLAITGVYGEEQETRNVPVNAEVIVVGGDGGGELVVLPSGWTISIAKGGSDSNTINVCNTTTSGQTNITLTGSGDAGAWLNAVTPISSLAAETCQNQSISLTVPGGTSTGTYLGTITVESNEGYSDTISLNVTVISSQADDFSFIWSTASFVTTTRIGGWTIENTGAETISIEKMTVSEWSVNDADSAVLNRVQLIDGTNYWTGSADDGQEISLTSNADLAASTSYTQNEIRFSANVNNDYEKFQLKFTFTDGSSYTTDLWPNRYRIDLWELASNLPQPLDFSTDINSSANTFGLGSGNDGWDWENDVYLDGDDYYWFNADPNDDNSTADSEVNGHNNIRIYLGDYTGAQPNSGTNANGAYGVQFEVSQNQVNAISGGATATLTFYWYMDDSGIDNGEAVWIKAAIGNSSGMNYLGSSLDSGLDATNEIEYDSNPNDHGATENIDVTSYITSAGTYYLEFGGRLASWNSNGEDVRLRFDNIDLTIE